MHVVLSTARCCDLPLGHASVAVAQTRSKPHWQGRTLIWVGRAVVAVLYILVPDRRRRQIWFQSSDVQKILPLNLAEIDHRLPCVGPNRGCEYFHFRLIRWLAELNPVGLGGW